MKCPECGYEDSKVIDSRPAENKIRRRRECLSCKCRFTTYEMVETIPLMVVKKDNTIFSPDLDCRSNRRDSTERICTIYVIMKSSVIQTAVLYAGNFCAAVVVVDKRD